MAEEKYYIKDGCVFEDEGYSNPLWEQPIDHPTTFSTPKHIAKENVQALHVRKSDMVLEISCGPGEYLYHLKKAKEVHAVEKHKAVIELVPDMSNVTLFNQDFLTFASECQYDIIICSPPLKDTMEDGIHLSQAMLEHSWPMLKVGGKLLLNYMKGDPSNSLLWLDERQAKPLWMMRRPDHKWFNLFQNALIVEKTQP